MGAERDFGENIDQIINDSIRELDLDNQQVIGVVCGQWGDTGKGKLVDLLAYFWADLVIRGTGGANAGHTFYDEDGKKYITHLLGSGILNEDVMNVLGRGVVVDPQQIKQEIDEYLETSGRQDINNFGIDFEANVVMPYHILADRVMSGMKSTGRGMAQVSADYIARDGITFDMLLNGGERLEKQIYENIEQWEAIIRGSISEMRKKGRRITHTHLKKELEKIGMEEFYSGKKINSRRREIFDRDKIVQAYKNHAESLKRFSVNTDTIVEQYIKQGKKVLLEGAQGTLLDIDFGMYPYVTSSSSSIKGLAKGSGLNPSQLDLTLVIAKFPYTSRVGSGPYPVCFLPRNDSRYIEHMQKYGEFGGGHREREDYNDRLEELIKSDDAFDKWIGWRIAGHEIGATTGRPRDVGRVSLSLLKYAIDVNTINGKKPKLVLTKTDVASSLVDEIELETSFTYVGEEDFHHRGITIKRGDKLGYIKQDDGSYRWNCAGLEVGDFGHFPGTAGELFYHLEPNYETFAWNTEGADLSKVKSYSGLPQSVRDVYKFLEDLLGVEIAMSTNGPEKHEVIVHGYKEAA